MSHLVVQIQAIPKTILSRQLDKHLLQQSNHLKIEEKAM